MDAITFFLTYPRTSGSKEDLYSFLTTIKPVQWARVALESHADGAHHFHCVVRFGKRVKTNSTNRTFDWMGRHPNITVPRKLKDVLEYIAKEGDFQDFGPVPASKDNYDSLKQLACSGLRDDFDRAALQAGISFQWAQHIWNRFGVAGNTIREPGEGIECMQLQGLHLANKTHVLIGPSGCGKSTWAKRVSPKPALWVNHLDDLKKLSNEHKSIIFDDMSFTHLPRETQIYLVDQDDCRTIHCRHTNATIPAKMPKIFTANSYPFVEDEAIRRRVQVFNIISFAP